MEVDKKKKKTTLPNSRELISVRMTGWLQRVWMSNVQLADKDNWLCLLSFPQPIPALSNPSHKKTARKPHSHARPVNDCLIVSLIRLLAKLSVITAWETGHYRRGNAHPLAGGKRANCACSLSKFCTEK